MERLIHTVNKLQGVFSTIGSTGIDLPQIVVVGGQSSGKSSVLENIVGRPCLPRGTGIVTKCPIVLQLIKTPEGATVPNGSNGHSSRGNGGTGATAAMTEWVEFPHLPERQRCVTNFEEVPDIINTEVEKRAGGSKGIVNEQLIMRIHSPNIINLTVVDLPGMVENAVEGQPEDMPEQINNLILHYISNPHSIILTVSAATNDIATSASIKLARTVDPNFDRTVAVITKLDLMDFGTDATDLLTGKFLKVKLGIIGVVNRSYEDIKNKRTIEESIEKEARFFEEKYPQLARQHGTVHLRDRLQKLLMEHIRGSLTPMQSHIAKTITQEEQRLQSLGDDVPEDKSSAMMTLIEKFTEAYKSAILGKNRDIQKETLTGGAKISMIFEDAFPSSVDAINPMTDLDDAEIRNTVLNWKPLEATMLVSESPYQDLTRVQILRLEGPAMHLAEMLNTEMLNIMEKCKTLLAAELNRFPKLSASIIVEVTEMLNERNVVAQKMLKDFVHIHSSFIRTIRKDFNESVFDLMKKCVLSKDSVPAEGAMPQAQARSGTDPEGNGSKNGKVDLCHSVRLLVNAYFSIVKETFLDYCPKALAYAVIYYMEKNMQRALVRNLYTPDRIETLVQENVIIAEERESIKEKLEQLNQATRIIHEVKEADF